jgi:hypothetical protein
MLAFVKPFATSRPVESLIRHDTVASKTLAKPLIVTVREVSPVRGE